MYWLLRLSGPIAAVMLAACAPPQPEPLVRLEDLYPSSRPGQFPKIIRLRTEVQAGMHGIMLVKEGCTHRPCLVGALRVPARLENTSMVQAMYDRAPINRKTGRLIAVLRVRPMYVPRPSSTGKGLSPPSISFVDLIEVVSLTRIAAPET